MGPAIDDFLKDGVQRDCDVPPGIVRAKLRKVGDVADVISAASRVDILGLQATAPELRDALSGLKKGTAVLPPPPDVVDLPRAGSFVKSVDGPQDVETVDVVPHLLPLVA